MLPLYYGLTWDQYTNMCKICDVNALLKTKGIEQGKQTHNNNFWWKLKQSPRVLKNSNHENSPKCVCKIVRALELVEHGLTKSDTNSFCYWRF